MKLHFEAIDGRGRVTRGVLKADSEQDARDRLMAEEIYPKRFTPAADDEPITWAPKVRRTAGTQRGGSADSDLRPVRHCRRVQRLRAGEAPVEGTLGLTEDGRLVFQSADQLVIEPADVEIANHRGFPQRILEVMLVDGRLLRFTAGTLFASSETSAIAKHLNAKPKKES